MKIVAKWSVFIVAYKNSQSFAIVFEKFRIFATIFGNNSSA